MYTTYPYRLFGGTAGDGSFVQSADAAEVLAGTDGAHHRENHVAVFYRTIVNTRHGTDIVPTTHNEAGQRHVPDDGALGDSPEESTIATARYGLFRLEHANDMAAAIEGALECRAVGGSDGTPGARHKVGGNEVVVNVDVGLGTAVVDTVGYPVEVAEVAHHIGAVAAGQGFRGRLLIGMETALGATDAIGVVVVARAGLFENGVMIALAAGVFHQGALAVAMLFRAVVAEVVGEPAHELAFIAINDMLVFVDGNLLVAKTLVVGGLDIATKQTALVVV